MLQRLWRWLQGYVVLRVRRGACEGFLNLAAAQRLELWNVRHRPDGLYACLRLADLRLAHRLAQQAGLRARPRRHRGLPFAVRRLRHRYSLLAGVAITAAVLIYLTSHVWVVQVRGAAAVDPRAVRAVAAAAGLRPGAWRPRLDLAAVEAAISQSIPQIAWSGITLQGTRAVVQVVEKQLVLPPQPQQRLDLVADRPCQLVRLVVLSGHALVKEGELVSPGQVLIEGVQRVREDAVAVPNQPRPEPDIALRDVRAQGIAQGRCWYQHYYELPRRTVSQQSTGKTSRQFLLRWQNRVILKLGRPADFARQRESRRSLTLPWWRNARPIVEVQMVYMEELRVEVRETPVPELIEQAKQRLAATLGWRLAVADRIEQLSASVVQEKPDWVGLTASAQVLQNIARPGSPQGPTVPGPGAPNAASKGGLPEDWSAIMGR